MHFGRDGERPSVRSLREQGTGVSETHFLQQKHRRYRTSIVSSGPGYGLGGDLDSKLPTFRQSSLAAHQREATNRFELSMYNA